MSGNDSANGTFMSAHLGGEISRRGFVKMALAAGAATLFASWGGVKALADTLSWPVPLGAMDNEIAGREILKCYAPSTVATFTEVLGLSNPSFYPNEYRDKNYADDLSKSPTLGIWGSSANDQPNCFLSNLVYRDKLGKKVDENYVAVIASALQGSTQFAVWDDEDGVPLFFKHRPDILAISPTDTWQQAEGKSNADMVKIINAFDKESEHYQDGDEKYNPSFVDFRAYYGKKLGYMYSLWDVADEADRLLAADTSRRARYTLRSVSDIAADVEQFMLATQYAVLRGIESGATKRKTVAVVGGVSDQSTGVIDGVDTNTGRARIDEFNAASDDFSTSTQWGGITNFNVRYYHAAAALESCCDSIADVLGVSDASDTNAPIIRDENGVLWARPEALMQCDAIIIRTQTTVTTIPGTEELHKIMREYGYTDENAWPDIFTSNPTLGGYGASNCSQYFWWYAFLLFVYPEIINPVYMSAFLITELYHIASSSISDVMDIICHDMSLPRGYELSIRGYSAADIRATFAEGLEFYLSRKDEIDALYPNLVMTKQMSTWLTDAKKEALGVSSTYFAPRRLTGDDAYEAMAAQIKSAFTAAETVIIAPASNFQNAVMATPLAALHKAPVVLVPKTLENGALPEAVSGLIADLGAKNYIIVGSTSAVPAAVETALKGLGLTAKKARVTASSHPATCVKVYNAGKGSWGSTAIVATSKKFASALSVSSYAYAKKAPIFLVSKKLSSAAVKALKKFKKIIIVGSTSEVSKAVKKQLKGKTVERWSGSTVSATGLKIAKKAVSGGLSANGAAFVSASKYTMSLAAGCVNGAKKAVILPVAASTAATAAAYVATKKPTSAFVFGDATMVSKATYDAIQQALS